MGKIYQGILGPVSGKVGGSVGGSWKGIATIKGYQPVVSNPQTASQVANREKMAFVVLFAQAILATVIKPLWDRFASKMSGYNAFVSSNKALFATALPSSPESLKTSIGKMAATPIATVVASDGDATVVVTWLNDAGQGFKLATDKAYLVVVNEASGSIKGFATNTARSALSASVELDAEVSGGNTLDCYLSFLRADGSVVSNNSFSSLEVS